METKDTAPFNSKTDKTGEKKKTGSKDVTEEDMAALFASIDVDGSGAIDVEELQYALEMMGMIMSINKVQVRRIAIAAPSQQARELLQALVLEGRNGATDCPSVLPLPLLPGHAPS